MLLFFAQPLPFGSLPFCRQLLQNGFFRRGTAQLFASRHVQSARALFALWVVAEWTMTKPADSSAAFTCTFCPAPKHYRSDCRFGCFRILQCSLAHAHSYAAHSIWFLPATGSVRTKCYLISWMGVFAFLEELQSQRENAHCVDVPRDKVAHHEEGPGRREGLQPKLAIRARTSTKITEDSFPSSR